MPEIDKKNYPQVSSEREDDSKSTNNIPIAYLLMVKNTKFIAKFHLCRINIKEIVLYIKVVILCNG